MQTPKLRPDSLEMLPKTSPTTSQTPRQVKVPGSGPNSVSSSPHKASRTPKEGSPKVAERRSPRSPAAEKQRPGRVAELESQVAQLQKDLNKAKEQLSSSESWKKQAQREAEEAKKQLLIVSANLEESQQQLEDIYASEEERLQELRKISQDRDRAWESELEAVRSQHHMDSAALSSAMNEIQKLRKQLEMASQTESAKYMHADRAHNESQTLQLKLEETHNLVDELKLELYDRKESEAQALEDLSNTQMQLVTAMATIETFKSEGLKSREAYNSLTVKHEMLIAQVQSLEELVSKLQADPVNSGGAFAGTDATNKGVNQTEHLKAGVGHKKSKVAQVPAALYTSHESNQEESIQSNCQIRSDHEQEMDANSVHRVAEVEGELKSTGTNTEEMDAKSVDRYGTTLESISEKSEQLTSGIEINHSIDMTSELNSQVNLADFKPSLMDRENELQILKKENELQILKKENELQILKKENELLKLEIEMKGIEKNRATDEAISLAEAARAAEREALSKVGYLTEETERSNQREARVVEQLNAAQASNAELESELRRLKVHSDQLRKAAETAAAMLSPEYNGKYGERKGSLDCNYHNGGNDSLPFMYDDDEEDSPKKKNGNMLKKIGDLWKKGHAQKWTER